jgi:hypothetical protein
MNINTLQPFEGVHTFSGFPASGYRIDSPSTADRFSLLPSARLRRFRNHQLGKLMALVLLSSFTADFLLHLAVIRREQTMKNALKTGLMSALILGSTVDAAMAHDGCSLYYRTTSWSSLLNFTPSPIGTNISTIYDPVSDIPTALHFEATGGSISKSLEVPPGFMIKKVLVCGTVPAPAFTVGLMQTSFDLSPAPVIPFAFDHVSAQQPSCAVYMASGPVDPRVAPTVLRIGLPAVVGDITAVGLRLEADPDSPVFGFVGDHRHEYLTGRGRGHNNTTALTSGASSDSSVCTVPPADSASTDDILDAYYLVPADGSGGDDDDDDDDKRKHKKGKGKGKDKDKDD